VTNSLDALARKRHDRENQNGKANLAKRFPNAVSLPALVLVLRLTCAQASPCAQLPPSTNSTPGSSAAGSRQATEVSASSAAELELQQALALRNELSHHSLQIALVLLADSSRKFAMSSAPARAAYAQLEAGDTYQMMSRYGQALASYRQSLAFATTNLEARCSALSHIVRTYANIGSLDKAKKYSAEVAAALCETIPDKKTLADVIEAQGEVSYWTSKTPEAIESFTRARELAVESNDVAAQALNSMMLAQALNSSEHQKSTRLAWNALNLWLSNKDAYGAARARLLLGYLASKEEDFHLAQCHCENALLVFRSVSDRDNAATASNILGLVARESGDLDASYASYRRALSDYAAAHDELGEAESVEGLARLLMIRHNYADLLSLYHLKLTIAKKTGYRALVASAFLDLAAVHAAQRHYLEAETNFQKALSEYRAAGNRYGEGVTLMRLVDLRFAQNRFDDALELSGQALKLKEETAEAEDVARIQYLRARIDWKLHRIDDARSEIEKTIAIIESQRLRIDKFDSRAQYFASVHEYYSLYIQVLMALHELRPADGYERLAFETAEKSKVRALLDMLSDSLTPLPCEQVLSETSNPDSPSIVRSTQISQATSALTLLETETQIASSNTVLVEYALGDEASYAWIVDTGKISAVKLAPASEIRKAVHLFRESLVPVRPAEKESPIQYLQRKHAAKQAFALQSDRLSKLLLSSLDIPPQKGVLIVPDGPLQYIPFALLAYGKTTVPFLELHDLTMLPSASALVALRKSASAREPPTDSVVVFADPVFENPHTSSLASSSVTANVRSARPNDLQRALLDFQGSQHIPSLPGSRTEALAIQEIFGSSRAHLALNFDATRDAVIDGSLAHPRVIHFATHGIVDTLHPEMSGLILSLFNRKGESQDGYLRLSDIYKLKLSADLVVLSSCESALGKDLESEGIIGLPRGFLYAGARSVIASLWKVDDDATAALMKALYSRMQRGESPSDALRGAQLELLKGTRFSDPYYWGAFVLEGDHK
jgi:CHAT domain-containing protein